jgi:HEAT repeat protein
MGLLPTRRPRIERLVRKRDVGGLCDALAFRDTVDLGAQVRRRAMAALNEIDDDRVAAVAEAALEDDDEGVRLEAARTLRRHRIADPLIGYLVRSPHDASDHVRAEAREALAELGGPGLGVALAGRLIRDGDETPGDDGDLAFLAGLLSSAPAVERHELARVAVEELSGDDAPRRERAFFVLSTLGDTGVGALRDALDQPRRAEAAAALGRLRDSGGLLELVDLLGDREARVRAAAARALGEIRDPRAVEGLLSASTDSEFVVREAASEALDQLGTSAIVFAVAAFVRPLLAAGTAAQIEPGTAAAEGGATELPPTTLELPRATTSPAPSRPAGTFDRLRHAARRARRGRRDA